MLPTRFPCVPTARSPALLCAALGAVAALMGVRIGVSGAALSGAGVGFVARAPRVAASVPGEVVINGERLVLAAHYRGVTSVAFSPDGRLLVSTGSDHMVRVWEMATGRPVRAMGPFRGLTDDAAFSPDGRLVLFADPWGGAARLFEVSTGRQVRALHVGLFGVNAAAYAPDGRTVATGGQERTVRLWSVATGRTVRVLRGHQDQVTALAFSRDGRLLLSGSTGDDETVRLWDVASGRQVRVLRGHMAMIADVGFAPDGRTGASASWDNTVRL